MKDLINITLIQPDIKWHNINDNIKQYDEYISKAENPDIIVLPEMFGTGFTADIDGLAQLMDGTMAQWMLTTSAEYNTAIAGSTIINDGGHCYNRLLMATPDGKLQSYDKHHLFRMGNENGPLTEGRDVSIFSYAGWRIMPAVCYDLRFPVWLRNRNSYDLLLCVANWPASRHNAWKVLLEARAIENQCYAVGVNRVGKDGLNIEYSGGSCVIDMYGSTICRIADGQAGIGQATLSLSKLNAFRNTFPAHLDADAFELRLSDNQDRQH